MMTKNFVRKGMVIFLFLLVLLVPKIGFAGSANFFLQIDGILGESIDGQHVGWIDVNNWSWSEKQPASTPAKIGGGASAPLTPDIQDFKFTMRVDKASSKLFEACALGTRLRSAVLSVCKASGNKMEFLKIVLTNVMVMSFNINGVSISMENPLIEVTLDFSKIEFYYTETDPRTGAPKGTIKSGWDVEKRQVVR